MTGFSALRITRSWVYEVSVLDLPASSSLSLDDLAFLCRSTDTQVPEVWAPLALVPWWAAALCFPSPLILHTLGKWTTGQEFAGICLIGCKRGGRF